MPSTPKERLIELLGFVHETAKLGLNPPARVSQHQIFSFAESEAGDCCGLRWNLQTELEEIWLAVPRLHASAPPHPPESLISRITLAPGPHTPPACNVAAPDANPDDEQLIQAAFAEWLAQAWQPWAAHEICVLKTVRLYGELFTLLQKLEGSLDQEAIELVWGVGMCRARAADGSELSYPLITQAVELALNSQNADLEIRPRTTEPQLELDWFSAHQYPDMAAVQRSARAFWTSSDDDGGEDQCGRLSPLDPGSYEGILRMAATHLDQNGRYRAKGESPEAGSGLEISDQWVIFARQRTKSLFLRDLQLLLKAAEGCDELPPAITAVVTEPSVAIPVDRTYRGMCSHHAGGDSELYFPKPYNPEQARIVALLDQTDGVVVQGPPGTGKTHTIANIVCHYLALGKRVLVTSMKDTALAVLRDQLPEDIRALAVALLTNEREGLKQFEHAVQDIASGLQSLDPIRLAGEIDRLEQSIDRQHRELAVIERDIGGWFERNLTPVHLGGEALSAVEAARLISTPGANACPWLPDPLGIDEHFEPRFSDEDIVKLRAARRNLGPDLDYLNATLPGLARLPDREHVTRVHRQLLELHQRRGVVALGNVPGTSADTDEAGLAALLEDITQLQNDHATLETAGSGWDRPLERLRSQDRSSLPMPVLDRLRVGALDALDMESSFLERPVTVLAGADEDQELLLAVARLARGERAFGLMPAWVKSPTASKLKAIHILGAKPVGRPDWEHVNAFFTHRRRLRELGMRWNAVCSSFGAPCVDEHEFAARTVPERLAGLDLLFAVLATENTVTARAKEVLPDWNSGRMGPVTASELNDLAAACHHHLAIIRLAQAVEKPREWRNALTVCQPPIGLEFDTFLTHRLGNPSFSPEWIATRWSELSDELARIHGLESNFQLVREVCASIQESGAPQWSEQLRSYPVDSVADQLLPDNWRTGWRNRRLQTHLDTIDGHRSLAELAQRRSRGESRLAHDYGQMVEGRIWLRLRERTSLQSGVVPALQAYVNAVRRLGAGTGVRAARYRRDARAAAAGATPAVPCWIMPHYRVCEALPPELGCFDLVIIDEASQSDLNALPAILRAKKVLVVGDDKQVSPEGAFIEEQGIMDLMRRALNLQIPIYRAQMAPDRSIYDLCRVVFANSSLMLKEHFRCAPAIIEYSRRTFYSGGINPLRIPRAAERLDPPLIDVLVEDGYRVDDTNPAEIEFILDEIKHIVQDPNLAQRSIGIVSLLADKQALAIWKRLLQEFDPDIIVRHQIACGDARTFQGRERDIMFLSMVHAPNRRGAALTSARFAQRFNVAASRARDRMYLVRSVTMDQLSDGDELRRGLLGHFQTPFAQDEVSVGRFRQRCESEFEQELFDELVARGYRVQTQVGVKPYRIDMVAEGQNNARLALECDGDRFHGVQQWQDDLRRQATLERAGWSFWRCFASRFALHRAAVLAELEDVLRQRGIEPTVGAAAAPSIHTESRRWRTPPEAENQAAAVAS